jgi:hypothetical protein
MNRLRTNSAWITISAINTIRDNDYSLLQVQERPSGIPGIAMRISGIVFAFIFLDNCLSNSTLRPFEAD